MAWARLGSLGGAALAVAAGAGVGLALSPAAGAGGLAGRMLDAVIVPHGAVQVSSLPGPVFARPSQEPACHPLTDEVRYWLIPGGPAAAAAFLKAHAPSWLPNDGTGWLGTTGGAISYEVMDAPRGKGFGAPAGLDLTVAALAGGMTGIRADAEVVPAGAACTSAGAAAGPRNTPAPGRSAPGSRTERLAHPLREGHSDHRRVPNQAT